MIAQKNTKTPSLEITYPLIIESRYGDICIQQNDVVHFPKGIYGFEDYNTYAITDFAGQTLTNFKILQCLDEVGLVFLLTPILQQNTLLIPKKDLLEATNYLEIDFDLCDSYAITTACEKDTGLEFSLNLKAPIIVDRKTKSAWQYILENSDYPIRHIIQLDKN